MLLVRVPRCANLVQRRAPQFSSAVQLRCFHILPTPLRRAVVLDKRRRCFGVTAAISAPSLSSPSPQPVPVVHCTFREGCDDWTLDEDNKVAINGSEFASQTSNEHATTGILAWTLLISKTPYVEVGIVTDDGDRLTMVRPMPEAKLCVRTVCDFDAGRIDVFEGDNIDRLAPVTWPVGERNLADLIGRSAIRLSVNGFHEMRVQLLDIPSEMPQSVPLVTSVPADMIEALTVGVGTEAFAKADPLRDRSAVTVAHPPADVLSSFPESPSSPSIDQPVLIAAVESAPTAGERYQLTLALGQAQGERDSALRELEHVRKERDEAVRRYERLRFEVEDAATRVDAARAELEAASKRLHTRRF